MTRSVVTSLLAGALAVVPTGCAGSRSEAIERETEAFYSDFEAEVHRTVRELGDDERNQLRDILPVAEVEGATGDVLDVIETRPSLRPMVRRIRRFLSERPSNRVRLELATEPGDRRLWHILLDSIQEELPASRAG